MRARSAVVLLGLVACGSKQGEGAPASDAERPSAAPGDGGVVAASAPDGAPVPAPAVVVDRKAYAAHLKAGRAHAAKKRWKDAVVELTLATTAAPGEAAGWSELGWAAFNGDDLELAARANAQALALATEPRLKAASLYNLGRVAERRGEVETARTHYVASLALRPNEAVNRRLVALGGGSAAPTMVEQGAVRRAPVPSECAGERRAAALCDCLAAASIWPDPWAEAQEEDEAEGEAADAGPPEPAAKGVCRPVGKGVAGYQVWRAGYGSAADDEHGLWVVVQQGSGVTALALLEDGVGLHRRLINEAKLLELEQRSAGARAYLWVEHRFTDYDGDDVVQPVEHDIRWVTIVPLAPTKLAPLRFPRTWKKTVSLEDDSPEHLADFKRTWGRAPPFVEQFTLVATLAEDGTATFVLEGKRNGVAAAFLAGPLPW